MKIEKISDTQVKFIFSKTDLLDRNINIDELILPTDKTQELFHDIMEQAMEECGFSVDDSPIMVEAVPVALDGIMIIVTKIQDKDKFKNKTVLSLQNKDSVKFKRKPVTNYEPKEFSYSADDVICIYMFNSLDNTINASIRLNKMYCSSSSLYKLNNKYFLVLEDRFSPQDNGFENIELILNEYGEKCNSSILSKYYLIEHGESLVKQYAVENLSQSFS